MVTYTVFGIHFEMNGPKNIIEIHVHVSNRVEE